MRTTPVRDVPSGGHVDPAFAAVGDAFRSNFEPASDGLCDLGAALCVIAGGRVVVDCWGGWRDVAGRRAWGRDTLVNAYSVLKPVAATLALRVVETGTLDLDEPVAEVWPDFAREGKGSITLRQVLAHRAGLPAARPLLPDDALYDWDAMCAALVASEPWWEPGNAHGYHVNTFGFLVGEPVRRATGMTFAGALREMVTGPLDLDLHVGVADADLGRVADVDAPVPAGGGAGTDDPERGTVRDASAAGDTAMPEGSVVMAARGDKDDGERRMMLLHTYFNPPGLSGFGIVNTVAWRQATIPSTNGHATARAVAAFYASLLPGASRPLLSSEMLREATIAHSDGHDLILDRPSRFGLGLALHIDARPVGATASAYGHYGYGGSLGFADPDAGIAFAYLINRPGDRWQNPRTRGLLDALRACL